MNLPSGAMHQRHVSTDGAGRMHHPEFRLELQNDSVLAPLGMIGRDAANQVDVAPGDSGPTAGPTGPSSPVAAVPCAVPPEDRGWLDQHECLAPPIPVPAEPNPEHSICWPEKRPGASSLKHGELMTEDGIISRQREAGSSHPTEGPKGQKEP